MVDSVGRWAAFYGGYSDHGRYHDLGHDDNGYNCCHWYAGGHERSGKSGDGCPFPRIPPESLTTVIDEQERHRG